MPPDFFAQLMKMMGGQAPNTGQGNNFMNMLGGNALGTAGSLALKAGGMAIPALPLVEGGIDLIGSLIKGRKANQAKQDLNTQDPALAKYMNELDVQRKTFESGSAYAQEMKELKNQQAAVNQGIVRVAKGNTGSALQAMQQSGLNTGIGYGKIVAKGQERQDLYQQMYGNMIQSQEQRRHEEKTDEYNQANLDARNQRVKGLQTLLNSLSLGQGLPKGITQGAINSFAQQTPEMNPNSYTDLPDKSMLG